MAEPLQVFHAYLECQRGDSYKGYDISIFETIKGEIARYELVTRYGRIGNLAAKGKGATGSLRELSSKARKILEAKKRKGYTVEEFEEQAPTSIPIYAPPFIVVPDSVKAASSEVSRYLTDWSHAMQVRVEGRACGIEVRGSTVSAVDASGDTMTLPEALQAALVQATSVYVYATVDAILADDGMVWLHDMLACGNRSGDVDMSQLGFAARQLLLSGIIENAVVRLASACTLPHGKLALCQQLPPHAQVMFSPVSSPLDSMTRLVASVPAVATALDSSPRTFAMCM